MRELEFLPQWYPTLRRKRTTLLTEGWVGLVVVACLGLWMLLAAKNVRGKEVELATYQDQVRQADLELAKLRQLQSLEQQMSEQARLVSRLGLYVPTGRILNALDQMMPAEMAMRDLTLVFQRQNKARSPLAAASDGADSVDRRLSVTLDSVAPSDVEVGNFMIQLATIPHFTMTSESTVDHTEYGRLMREFKFEFTIDLNDADH